MWLLAVAVLAGAVLFSFVFLKPRTRRNTGRLLARSASGGAREGSSALPSLWETEAVPGNDDKTWWENADYFWVVLCKNEQFHLRLNPSHAHKIPLGQTDTVLSLPASKPFKVRCDSCGKEYVYEPLEVMRWEMKTPECFEPHPLFLD